jgi:endonuclease-3 related protein
MTSPARAPARTRPPAPDRRFLRLLYARLRRAYGHAAWWPGQSPLEVCVGAILTQNTAWTGAERALAGLRARGLLELAPLLALERTALEALLRPAGTFRVKARRLRAFLEFVRDELDGRVEGLRRGDAQAWRRRLLQVRGIGPETADAILLYAARRPVFVVDAYTRRICSRLGLAAPGASYGDLQRLFTSRLRPDAALFNDYHAQLVRLGKEACRARPLCPACPLADLCPRRGLPRAGARRRR